MNLLNNFFIKKVPKIDKSTANMKPNLGFDDSEFERVIEV